MTINVTTAFWKSEPTEALAIVYLGCCRVSGHPYFLPDQQHSENIAYSDSDLKNAHESGWRRQTNNLGSRWQIALLKDFFKIKEAKGE